MKTFEVTTKTVYKPIWVKEDFYTYDESFINIRSRMEYKCKECIKCHHKFEIGETIGIAGFEGIGNKVLCVPCAKEIK
jgi:hypothetical protein